MWGSLRLAPIMYSSQVWRIPNCTVILIWTITHAFLSQSPLIFFTFLTCPGTKWPLSSKLRCSGFSLLVLSTSFPQSLEWLTELEEAPSEWGWDCELAALPQAGCWGGWWGGLGLVERGVQSAFLTSPGDAVLEKIEFITAQALNQTCYSHDGYHSFSNYAPLKK